MPITDTNDSRDPKIIRYQEEYNRNREVLEIHHTERFDKNYRQYTALTETQGTHTKISDPVAPEQVERVVQKMFQRDPNFLAMAKGKNIPKEISQVIEATAKHFWTAPERVQKTGSQRQKLKVLGREFLITGNCETETYYDSKSESPDFRVIPIEDDTFNATQTLKNSDFHYITQFVSPEYLEEMAEEYDEAGDLVGGIFKKDAVERILKKYKDESGKTILKVRSDPTSNQVKRSGSNSIDHKVADILLVTRWEGKKCCRIADWEEIVQEFDFDLLDDDPLDQAMDIEVPKEPYAFSLLDFINGLTTAKDLILNQVVDYGTKALNPPLFADPSIAPINQKTLRNAWRAGGLVFARPDQAAHLPMPNLPPVGFELLGYLQQRSEGVSGVGGYLGGVPNQESDTTQGTKGGIQTLVAQAQSPVQDRQMNLEESIVEPIINKMMKMAGVLMGKDETKFVLITGQQPKWVEVTKNMLMGKITLKDLVTAELLDEQGAMELALDMLSQGKNPETEVIFDVDWIIRVETGSMADADTQKDLQNFDGWVAFNAQFGVPMNVMEISKERAERAGIKEPDRYLLQQPSMPPGMPGDPSMQGQPPMPGMMPQEAPAMPMGA